MGPGTHAVFDGEVDMQVVRWGAGVLDIADVRTGRAEFPLLIAIRSGARPCVAVIDQVKAAAKEHFIRKLAVASAGEMAQISEALATELNLG